MKITTTILAVHENGGEAFEWAISPVLAARAMDGLTKGYDVVAHVHNLDSTATVKIVGAYFAPKGQHKKVLDIEFFAAGSWQGENKQEGQER